MAEKNPDNISSPDSLRLFMKNLLTDLRALECILADGKVETGVRRIGAEQELVLVDSQWHVAPVSIEVLELLDDPMFTTELARFNLEFNLPPLVFKGDCLSALERKLNESLARVSDAAKVCGAKALLSGILPTIRKSDLELSNLTPKPRYLALNEALRRLRGDAFEFRFAGTDELIIRHDSVMLEACNTSFQIHFQVAPDEFAKLYNVTQVCAAPVLASAVNSPLLFGKRLWRETRIALFQQAVDTRSPGHQLQDRSPRVSFGNAWVKESVLEIFREDIARFRVVMGMEVEEDPFDALSRGEAPRLQALQLHNSTVYRWMRPCYGICEGKPHLRIENRVLPAGPSILDEVANSAFWFGLINGVLTKYGDVSQAIDFDDAKTNFLSVAQLGLDAQLTWLDGTTRAAPELILHELLPLAHAGLEASHIDAADVRRYLGVIEQRVGTARTGARWLLDSVAALKGKGTPEEHLIAATGAMWSRQQQGSPVHEWPLAKMTEAGGWQKSYRRVEQYMTTDVLTVHADEVIDLVANLMDWERIRHVPVEDDQHRLVGLISYRQLLRFLARDLPHDKRHPVPASEIMQPNPITVSPETLTLDAIDLMRREKVACLPVVKDGLLVGIVTEADFLAVAADLLETQLREA